MCFRRYRYDERGEGWNAWAFCGGSHTFDAAYGTGHKNAMMGAFLRLRSERNRNIPLAVESIRFDLVFVAAIAGVADARI